MIERKHIVPTLNIIALCLTFTIPIWYGIWYTEASKKIIEDFQSKNLNIPTFLETNLNFIFDFKSPVPYIFLCVLLITITQVKFFITEHQLQELKKNFSIEQDKNEDLRTKINNEQESHAETRKNYHQSLNSHLEILCKNSSGYELSTCRASIYRIDREANKCRLIFRICNISKYERRGRVSIPIDEGVVGATIQNGDSTYISISRKRYIPSMRKSLALHGVDISETTMNGLNMKSLSYYERAVRDLQTNEKIAILILESTDTKKFDKNVLDEFFTHNQNEFTKWVQHITLIDSLLNPYGGNV